MRQSTTPPVFEHPITPIDCRVLPTIDGIGLTPDEFRRVHAARNRTRRAYVASVPDADPSEVEAVAEKAARDQLRRVLADRPAAPPIEPDPLPVEFWEEVERADPIPCCDPFENEPCGSCRAAASQDPWDVEADPADWPAETDNWYWTITPEPIAPAADDLWHVKLLRETLGAGPDRDDEAWWARESNRTRKPRKRTDRGAPIDGLTDFDHMIAHACV